MRRVLFVVLAVGMAACGGSQPSGQVASIGPSPSAGVASPGESIAPTQEELRAAAATAYRRAVAPYNKTRTKLFKAYGKAVTLKSWKTYCSKLDVASRTFIKATQAITWPTDTGSDAKALIRAEAAADANLRSCAKATTKANWQHSWDLYGKANSRAHEAANLVRLDVGLEPVPN